MKSAIFFAIGACLILSVTDGLVLEKRDSPAVVKFPLQRVTGIPASQKLRRHKRSFGTPLYNEQLVWTVSLNLGTPPQTTRVQLDTGSSDLVVETDYSNLCASRPTVCSGRGAYDANSSSTYTYINSDLSISYGGGDGAKGDYASDILNIDGEVIQNMQFGIMYTTTVLEGILGVSFPAIEFQVLDGGSQYDNLPILLVKQGYIQSAAFSVWLNDDQGNAGTVLFGGVDTDKYYGGLVTLPFVTGPDDAEVRQCYVTLQGVQMSNGPGNPITLSGGSTPVAALLDTGTTLIDLPDAVAESIYSVLGAVIIGGLPYVSCTLVSSSFTVDFIFDGITINVPLSQLIIPNQPGNTCILGILSSTDVILGDTFLSSVYVVFDLANKEASLAPAVLNSTSENILQIGTGPNSVPEVSGLQGSSSPTSSMSSATSTISSISSTLTTSVTSSTSTTSGTSTISSSSSTLTTSMTSSTFTTSGTSATSTTSYMTTTAEPIACAHDNCFRAIIRASATSFCSGYLAGSAVSAPSDILNKCSASPSRISSGCSCLETGG